MNRRDASHPTPSASSPPSDDATTRRTSAYAGFGDRANSRCASASTTFASVSASAAPSAAASVDVPSSALVAIARSTSFETSCAHASVAANGRDSAGATADPSRPSRHRAGTASRNARYAA
eukprot:30057-Pelagococcus_subviridis.AAC.2